MTSNNYFDYYTNLISESQDYDKDHLTAIYKQAKEKCMNMSAKHIHTFIIAWLKDAIDEKPNTIGPKFTMAIAYYNGTYNDIIDDLYGSWFEEAAIRDYILESNRFPDEVQKLKNIDTLEINTTSRK